MPKLKVHFSDGSSQIFHEEQQFKTYYFQEMKGWTAPSFESIEGHSFNLLKGRYPNLVQSFLEMLSNSNFFFDIEEPETIYNSQSVVKIEIINPIT
ncbi:hypothetical protein ACYSNW_17675 [Enterococcus sp. LJL99]